MPAEATAGDRESAPYTEHPTRPHTVIPADISQPQGHSGALSSTADSEIYEPHTRLLDNLQVERTLRFTEQHAFEIIRPPPGEA